MEVKCSSEAIQILSPSMTMPYSLRRTVVESLHNPTVETNIMSKFLAEALLGKIPLASTNENLSFFIYDGYGPGNPITFKKVHIFAILEFDHLLGYPLDKLFQEKYPHGSLSEEFGKLPLPLT
jgi:hypothetical protein